MPAFPPPVVPRYTSLPSPSYTPFSPQLCPDMFHPSNPRNALPFPKYALSPPPVIPRYAPSHATLYCFVLLFNQDQLVLCKYSWM